MVLYKYPQTVSFTKLFYGNVFFFFFITLTLHIYTIVKSKIYDNTLCESRIVIVYFEFFGFIFRVIFFLLFRCEVPLCDTNDPSYDTPWLRYAIPPKSDVDPDTLQKCSMYEFINATDGNENSTCESKMFDRRFIKQCDRWVFGETEKTIVNDVRWTSRSIILLATHFFLHRRSYTNSGILIQKKLIRFYTVRYYVRREQMETQHGGNDQQHRSVHRHPFGRIHFGQVSTRILYTTILSEPNRRPIVSDHNLSRMSMYQLRKNNVYDARYRHK